MFDFLSLCTEAAPIDDCYALNVSSNHETWLYYYTDFPLVRLTDHQLNGIWQDIPVSGSPAFAVAKDCVLFAGGYHNRSDLIRVSLPVRQRSQLKSETLKPVTENGQALEQFSAFGRSRHLYLATEKSLFVVDAGLS